MSFTSLISHIQVGRMKIETPTVTLPHSAIPPTAAYRSASQDSGHAFILRRFDTGAISLTTMFRAAFPNAPEHDEKAEVQWVKDNYDLSGNNGSSKDNHITRLAGVWVSPRVALELSHAYKIDDIISSVVEAAPDPNGNYRRSGKAAAAAAAASSSVNAAPSPSSNAGSALPPPPIQSATKSLPTPSPSSPAPNPLKRRKESSPAPTPLVSSPPEDSKPLPRRSARTKSPAPRSAAQMAPLTSLLNQTPKASRSSPKKQEELVVTPGGSEETVVEDVAGSDLHEEDVSEQQKLIADLKAQRDAKLAEQQQQEDEGMESGDSDEVDGPSKLKRAREEEDEPAFKFEFKEPEVVERPVATNSRVRRFTLEPRTKSFAWGLAAFAVGMGAV
jgi:hypothetical protein